MAVIISKHRRNNDDIRFTCEKIANYANNNYTISQMHDFSNSSIETANDILIRENKEGINIYAYSEYMLYILKYLNNNDYKNIFISNICNGIPNFIDGDGNPSKLTVLNGLEKDIIRTQKMGEIAADFKIDETIKFASILDSCALYDKEKIKETPFFNKIKSYVKTDKQVSDELTDSICHGIIGIDKIQTHLKTVENLGFFSPSIYELIINNFYKRGDIYIFIKKPIIQILYKEFMKLDESDRNYEDSFLTKFISKPETRTERISKVNDGMIIQNSEIISREGGDFIEVRLDGNISS